MTGRAITECSALRDPQVGERVLTTTGGEGVAIANTNHLNVAKSHAIRVNYDGGHHVVEDSYRKVYPPKRERVPTIESLAKAQQWENELARVWATGMCKARKYILNLEPLTKVLVPKVDEAGCEIPNVLPDC